MERKQKLVSLLQIGLGGFFLFSMASDIQLGFGLMLLTQGMANWPEKTK